MVAHVDRSGALTGGVRTGFRLRKTERTDPFAGNQLRKVFALLLFCAERFNALANQGVVHRHDDGAGIIHFRDLLHREYVRKGVHAAAAIFRRHHHA